jgi:hypothetical protein
MNLLNPVTLIFSPFIYKSLSLSLLPVYRGRDYIDTLNFELASSFALTLLHHMLCFLLLGGSCAPLGLMFFFISIFVCFNCFETCLTLFFAGELGLNFDRTNKNFRSW